MLQINMRNKFCKLFISFIKRLWLKRAAILLRGLCDPCLIIIRAPYDRDYMKQKNELTGPVHVRQNP